MDTPKPWTPDTAEGFAQEFYGFVRSGNLGELPDWDKADDETRQICRDAAGDFLAWLHARGLLVPAGSAVVDEYSRRVFLGPDRGYSRLKWDSADGARARAVIGAATPALWKTPSPCGQVVRRQVITTPEWVDEQATGEAGAGPFLVSLAERGLTPDDVVPWEIPTTIG